MSSFLMCSLCVPLSVGLVPALRQGVVHVFSLCAPVCWSCAGITSGGSFMCSLCVPLSVGLVLALRQGVVSCVLSVYPCLLVLCRHYVRG